MSYALLDNTVKRKLSLYLIIAVAFAAAILVFPSIVSAKLIVIEPGHGGGDPGAIGYGGFYEKTVNLAIALKLNNLLLAAGFQTVMTRTSDAIDQDEDADMEMANRIGADMFVSIHNDANESASVNGDEMWYLPKSPRDVMFATLVHAAIINAIRDYGYSVYDWGLLVPNSGWMINRGQMPSILIEGLFVTNPYEAFLLQDPGFQAVLARGIYNGVVAFAGSDDVSYDHYGGSDDMNAGQLYTAPVTLTNNGRSTWSADGAYPTKLSYHWVDAQSGKIVLWDGERTTFSADVLPGESLIIDTQIIGPPARGVYILALDLVKEGQTWFSWQGIPTGNFRVFSHDSSTQEISLRNFVTAVYSSLLLRPADWVGLNTWSAALDYGLPRYEMAARIMAGHEYHLRMVNEMYRDVLGRSTYGDGDTGREVWASAMDNGLALRRMRAAVYGSAEFINNYHSSESYVDFLYQNILRRPADSSGRAAWISALDKGMPRWYAAYSFMSSTEFFTNYVTDKYREILLRDTDASGLSAWVAGMRDGLTEDVLPSRLYGSDEYFSGTSIL